MQPKDVQSTCVTLDGVDCLCSACFTLMRTEPPEAARAVCLVRTEVQSWFDLAPFVDNLLFGALKYSKGGVVAATLVDSGHFTFVNPKWLCRLRLFIFTLVLIRDSVLGFLVPESCVLKLPSWMQVVWHFFDDALRLDTFRAYHIPPTTTGKRGVFEQTSGLVVAWLEGEYRPKNSTVQSRFAWKQALLPNYTDLWKKNEL
jgi:hypothetical protein